MMLAEDEILKKHGKHSLHYTRNTLLPYEYDCTCVACGCIITKKKIELSKISKKNWILLQVKFCWEKEHKNMLGCL